MKKFELTKETCDFEGRVLCRIKALRSFSDVKEGELGGWIENEENLSHEDNCWIYGDSVVYGDSKVSGQAEVFGNAKVSGGSVTGKARVYGSAQVSGGLVAGSAIVRGTSIVMGGIIDGYADVTDGVTSSGYITHTVSATPIVVTGLMFEITVMDEHIRVGSHTHPVCVWSDPDDQLVTKCEYRFWVANLDLINALAAQRRAMLVA